MPGMNEWRAFMKEYLPDADMADYNYVYAYGVGGTIAAGAEAVRQRFLARERHEAGGQPDNLELPTLLPGIKVNTSPTNFHPIRQMQLQRWNGTRWELFGDIIEGSGA